MTEINQETSNFVQFMQNYSPLISGAEAFLSTFLSENLVSQLLGAAKSAKNSIALDPKLTSSLAGLADQNALLNKAKVLGLASDLLKHSAVLAPIVAGVYTDLETGNNDAGQKAIASLGVGAMLAVLVPGMGADPRLAAALAAGIAGLIDSSWDDIKENTGGFLDDPEGFVRDIFQNVPLSKLLDKDTQQCLPDSLIEESQREFGNAETLESPLIFDLNGDGVKTTKLEDSSVYFDHDKNGFAEKTAWVSTDDGILVRDINGNGKIDNGGELFGGNTVLLNGLKAANGFEALKDLDSNGDGVFDVNDTAFNELLVWHDINGDGVTDISELKSLLDSGVSSISLTYTNDTYVDANGNKHNQTGMYTDANGVVHTINDVWFQVDTARTKDLGSVILPDEILDMPNLGGLGNVHDLWTAMALDETGAIKNLLVDFMGESNKKARLEILDNLVYHWTGVDDVAPNTRGAYIDARKLEALEALLGDDFFGGGCPGWNNPGPNPNFVSAPKIIEIYNNILVHWDYQLLVQSAYKDYFSSIQYDWDSAENTWKLDFDATASKMIPLFAQDPKFGYSFILDFVKNKDQYGIFGGELIDQWKSFAKTGASEFELYLSMLNNSFFEGTPQNDHMTRTADNDFILGLDGNDVIYGASGNDIILSGDGDDTINGGGGNDYLDGGVGNDRLNGDGGNDTYRFGFGYGNDWLSDGSGNDTIEFKSDVTAADVTVTREWPHVRITLSDGSSILIDNGANPDRGGYVIEKLKFNNGQDADVDFLALLKTLPVNGTANGEYMYGYNDADDTVYAGAGNDAVYGKSGNDTLYGEEGDDTINGESGNDSLYGGIGDDKLYGGYGNDYLEGGVGDDTLYGDGGDDYLEGGVGDDRLEGGNGDDIYRFGFGYGNDVIYDTSGMDTIEFMPEVRESDISIKRINNDIMITLSDSSSLLIQNSGHSSNFNNWIEKIHFTNGVDQDIDLSVLIQTLPIYGSDGNDVIDGFREISTAMYGGSGNDKLDGWNQDDFIYGGAGNDELDGGAGNDYFEGGKGNDALTDRIGEDTYVFNAGDGQDTIRDRAGSNDMLSFSDINYDSLWFQRYDNGLKVTVNGAMDSVTIQDWYTSDTYKIETIQTADHTLSHTAVEQLVQAMAGFNPPVGGISEDAALSGVLSDALSQTWQTRAA